MCHRSGLTTTAVSVEITRKEHSGETPVGRPCHAKAAVRPRRASVVRAPVPPGCSPRVRRSVRYRGVPSARRRCVCSTLRLRREYPPVTTTLALDHEVGCVREVAHRRRVADDQRKSLGRVLPHRPLPTRSQRLPDFQSQGIMRIRVGRGVSRSLPVTRLFVYLPDR
jgi:hypothetical protein